MSEPNFTTMSYDELKTYADFAADWMDERGLSVSSMVDLRKSRQDRGLLLGVVWAWREMNDNLVDAMNKAKGMNGRVGTES
jgi:hypothetical protein